MVVMGMFGRAPALARESHVQIETPVVASTINTITASGGGSDVRGTIAVQLKGLRKT